MTDRLRVGIVGAHRGAAYIPGFSSSPHTEIVAICDLDPARLNETADLARCEHRFASYDEMLDRAKLDIVVIATPMPLHVPLSIAALRREIHVMSDVPAATDLQQCWDLVCAVRAAKHAKYMMAENCCYMKFAVLVGAMIDAGLLGEVYYGHGEYLHDIKERVGWRRFWQSGIDGNTYPTHSIGPLLKWMKTRVVSVSCRGSGRHHLDARGESFAQDTSYSLCKLANGGLATLRLDLVSTRPLRRDYNSFELQGTKGCFESAHGPDDIDRVWIDGRCADRHTWRRLTDFEDEFLPASRRHAPPAAREAGHDGSDYFQVIDFIDCILHNRKIAIDVYDGLDMTLPGLVSQESIRQNGAPLPVPDFRTIRRFPQDLPGELQSASVLRIVAPT